MGQMVERYVLVFPSVGAGGVDGPGPSRQEGRRVCTCVCKCRTRLHGYNKTTRCSLCQERSRKKGSACRSAKAPKVSKQGNKKA
ncbi:MAG: hypothetical protein QG668_375 [Patescibacteria group bacterium]|nr:hypothetical protein [Patescibacteria group bacterium]